MSKRFIIAFSSVLIFAGTAFAQNSAPSTSSTVNTVSPTVAVSPVVSSTLPMRGRPNAEARNELRQDIKADVTAFKNKIAQIRDEKKKILVEKITTTIETINTNRTNTMIKTLDMLSSYLTRLKERAAILKTSGKDTKNLDAAIVEAEALINLARDKVKDQALKTYTAAITSDATLKSTIGGMVSTFRLDIVAVHKAVVDAKQAVMKARMELAKLTGEGNKSATNSAGTKL